MHRLTFALLLACAVGGAAEDKPVVVWASDPIRPGQTVLVTGAGFGEKPRVGLCQLQNNSSSRPDDAGAFNIRLRPVETLQPTDGSLKFTIPASFKPGVYYSSINSGGNVLNRPAVWWVQGDQGTSASPGGWLRLFGKNLGWTEDERKQMGEKVATTVLLKGAKEERLMAEADCFAAKIALPENLPSGEYEAYVHNGCGGSAGWSLPVKFSVKARANWPAETFNVRDFGAEGDGQKDDTAAIVAALEKAEKNKGGIVYLPRGRYKVSDALSIPRFTVLRGEKTEFACLCWVDAPKPPQAMIRGTNSFGIEDLTVYSQNHQHIIVSDQGDKPDAGNVFLRRVRVRANAYRGHPTEAEVDERFRNSMKWSTGGGDTIRLGGENVEVTDCDLYGSGRALYLSRTRGGLLSGNKFYNGRWGWYCISGSDGVIFENNQLTGGDLMSTGGGLNCLDGSPYSQNIYYAHNRLSMMHGWDREAMTSDAGGEVYFGKVAASGSPLPREGEGLGVRGTTLVLPEAPKWGKRSCAGLAVLVLEGKGAGQCRRLVSCDAEKLLIDRPFDIELDGSSVIGVTMYQGHYLILDNDFTDTGAMQFYGTSIECFAAQNRGTRTQGFRGLGLWYHGYQPSWFCQFLDNRILDGNYYHWTSAEEAFVEVHGAKRPPCTGPLNRASVVRGNILSGNAHLKVTGFCRDVLVEQNQVSDADTGVFVGVECANVLVRENKFSNVKHEVMDEVAARKAAEERVKQYMGKQEPVVVLDFEVAPASAPAGRFTDRSGNGFSAKVNGNVKAVAGGVKGQAASFDGTGWLTIEDGGVFNVPDVTVSFWAKPEVITGRRGLASKRFSGREAPFVIAQNGAAVSFEAQEDGAAWTFNFGGPPVLKAGTWAHIAAVVKQGVGVTLYVDGVAVAEKKNPARRATNPDPLVLGREAWGGDPPKGDTPGFYKGLLDEFKLWTRALTPEEIKAEVEKGK
ncbi:MAG TPA: LamG-like jellyroll fold domain-containing protein [Planctomycetota bacterium]|jgi:hypothetical protein